MTFEARIWPLRLGFGPRGWDLDLQARIWPLKVRIWATRLEFGPRDWDLGLETGIWASRLETNRHRRRKSPICVKAKVIDPIGAAAQKVRRDQPTEGRMDGWTDRWTKRGANRVARNKNWRAYH